MKKSKYNYILKYIDEYIVFNTLNTSLVLLNKEEYESFNNGDVLNDESNLRYVLYSNGILVDDDFDEKAIIDYDRAHLAFSKANRHFRILTTTACNARCKYCYEAGVNYLNMNQHVQNRLLEYIKEQTKEVEEFSITWFGGEPLLGKDVIAFISKELNSYANTSEKKWSASIVSNGSLLDETVVAMAKSEWNVNSIQITLDGTKEKYEEIKGYVDDTTFEKVISNIKIVCLHDIRVMLRLNFDKQNYEQIKELIYLLYDELKDYNHWSMYVYPIFDNTDGSYDEDCVKKIVELEKIIAGTVGTNESDIISLPKYSHGRCVFCSVVGETILPDGGIMKCCRHINKEAPFASIFDKEVRYNNMYARWCTPSLPSKCEKCVLLPICQGGCRAEQMIGQDGCLPRARVIDEVLVNYVENHIKQV